MRVQQKSGHEFTVGLQTAIMLLNIRIYIYIKLFPFCKDNNNKKKNLYTHCKKNGRNYIKIRIIGASLVAQWLRICLPMQGTRVRALVWEDPTCRGATRPVSHNH